MNSENEIPVMAEEVKPERQPMSKKLRFEVFKRDSFKCQYCGAVSPDVLLHVDHIRPVCDGGTNDILNLITACEDCNLGKGGRLLSDDTVVVKARTQLEALQDRREQIELMMEWQRGLMDLESDTLDAAEELWEELTTGFHLTAVGRDGLSKVVRKFGLPATLDAMRTAANYFRIGHDGKNTQTSVQQGFSKIGGICELNRRTQDKPYLKDLYYLRNILGKRIRYCPPYQALNFLESAYLSGVPVERLKEVVLQAKNWSQFTDRIAFEERDAQ